MNSIQIQDSVVVMGNRVVIDGEELPPAPCKGNNVTTIDGKVYIDGYEFKKGKWKKTFKAWYYKWFS